MHTATTDPKAAAMNYLIPLLRLEGLVIGLAAIAAYATLEQGWTLFAILILAPDLAIAGYAFDRRVGAVAYNTTHSYLGPAAIGAISWYAGWSEATAPIAIWIAHIGLDRAIGYGLKHSSGFKHTLLSPQVLEKTPLSEPRGTGFLAIDIAARPTRPRGRPTILQTG
ncbi:DUF4260 domain-containing protein [Pseudophaeobacter sp.]|uniref:DUF4260 domain-containing protein n=1 Tax=Pseudophaeobacter sp. TaxID=1971739 RepID=UPI00329A5131